MSEKPRVVPDEVNFEKGPGREVPIEEKVSEEEVLGLDSKTEKKEAKAGMKRPEGISLSGRLNEIKNNPDLLKHLETQLAGEKVYHFKKGVKQYLTVEDIQEKDGQWVATLIAYGPDGQIEKTIPDYKIDKIKFKHWKKELPKEVEGEAFIRDDKGNYQMGSVKELNSEKLIKHEYEGGVAYAEQSDRRPKAPEVAEAPKPETSAPRKVDLEVESESVESSGEWSVEAIKEFHKFVGDLIKRYEELLPKTKKYGEFLDEDVSVPIADINGNIEHYGRILREGTSLTVSLEEFKKEAEEIYRSWADNYTLFEGDDLEDDSLDVPLKEVQKEEEAEAERLSKKLEDDFNIEELKDDGPILEAGVDQKEPEKEKPKLGFLGKFGGFLGLWKYNEYMDLRGEELIKKEKELDERIEMDDGKPYTCPKCGNEYLLDMGNPRCPSCRGITPFLKKLKKRKKELDRLSQSDEVEDLEEGQIVQEDEEDLSEKEIKLLKSIEKMEGKKVDCPKCHYRFTFHSSSNECPSCERTMFMVVEKLKKRKKEIDKMSRLENHE